MKKTFLLTHPKIKPARLIEAIRRDVKKYLKREKRKPLPDGADYWDFDCKFGPTEDKAETILVSEISKCITEVEAENLQSFYLEILAKPGLKKIFTKPKNLDNS
jgi:hypothetical protein|tara:strand:+ start:133 stop:444 length:312 start_codon:yes stop_codon:yes gene_type:complete